MISMRHLSDELIKEIQLYLPNIKEGFIFIRKHDLSLHSSYYILFEEDCEEIDVDKLKEILLIKHLKD